MHRDIKKDTETILKLAGLRITLPRKIIMDSLASADGPLSQNQIAKAVGPDGPDKVTIYRTLDSLVKKNIVHKAFLRKRTWHFELAHNCSAKQCHPHFTCTKCGRTHCLHELSIPPIKSRYKDFLIVRQQTQLEGICPKCNTKPPSSL